jgi:hypothetical protein
MTKFHTETEAFKAAGDKAAELAREGTTNTGFRVLRHEGGFKVLMVPETLPGYRANNPRRLTPFYL